MVDSDDNDDEFSFINCVELTTVKWWNIIHLLLHFRNPIPSKINSVQPSHFAKLFISAHPYCDVVVSFTRQREIFETSQEWYRERVLFSFSQNNVHAVDIAPLLSAMTLQDIRKSYLTRVVRIKLAELDTNLKYISLSNFTQFFKLEQHIFWLTAHRKTFIY